MKPLVAIDCDGVLADFAGAVLDRLGTGAPDRSEIIHHDLSKVLSETQYSRMLAFSARRGFCESIQPLVPFYAVDRLREHARVVCITSPLSDNPHWYREREGWLLQYFGFRPKDVIFCSSEYKSRFSADALIEDRLDTLTAWKNRHEMGYAQLVHQPWNWPGPAGAMSNHFRSESTTVAIARVCKWLVSS